jgi:hypothetical protein
MGNTIQQTQLPHGYVLLYKNGGGVNKWKVHTFIISCSIKFRGSSKLVPIS